MQSTKPETTKTIYRLLSLFTKKEISYLLEISRPTFDKLLINNQWKNYQCYIINFIDDLVIINKIKKAQIINNKLVLLYENGNITYDLARQFNIG